MENSGEREIFQDFGLALDLTYRKYDRFATLPGFYTGLTDMKAWYYPDTKHWISQSDYMEAGKIPATLVDSNGKVISTGAAAGKSWYVLKEGVEYTDYNYESNYSNDRYNDFYGIDLVANKRLSHRWMMNGSISLGWQKAYYGKSGYVDPNNIWAQEGEPYAVYLGGGSGKLSIPAYTVWMAKLQGLYQLPLDFDVSFTSTARQGWVKPEGLTLANYDLPNSNKQDAWIQIKKMNDYDRLPVIWYINARLQKVLRATERGRIYLMVDCFNAFNADTLNRQRDIDYGTFYLHDQSYAATPRSGEPNEILNPRVFRFGVRFEF